MEFGQCIISFSTHVLDGIVMVNRIVHCPVRAAAITNFRRHAISSRLPMILASAVSIVVYATCFRLAYFAAKRRVARFGSGTGGDLPTLPATPDAPPKSHSLCLDRGKVVRCAFTACSSMNEKGSERYASQGRYGHDTRKVKVTARPLADSVPGVNRANVYQSVAKCITVPACTAVATPSAALHSSVSSYATSRSGLLSCHT